MFARNPFATGLLSLLLLCLTLTGCGTSQDTEEDATGPIVDKIGGQLSLVGKAHYMRHCIRCHALNSVSPMAMDTIFMESIYTEDLETFEEFLRDPEYYDAEGMPHFDEELLPSLSVTNLYAFLKDASKQWE